MDETYEDKEKYYYECIHFDSLEDEVKTGKAWAAIGGIAIDNRRRDEGFEFTVPILHTGLHLVSLGVHSDGYWTWLKSFSAGLWAAILVTSFGLGFVIYLIERVWIATSKELDDSARGPLD